MIPHFEDLSSSLLVSHTLAALELEREDEIHLLERQASGFDVEVPDEWDPSKIKNRKDDVELPSDVRNRWRLVSAVRRTSESLYLPGGVMDTIT